MANTLDDLWGEILRSTTVRVSACTCLVLETLLRQAEVCDLDVPFVIQQHILWLQIAINYTVCVQVAQSFNQLRCIEACSTLAELLILAQVVEKLATVEEVHDEVELAACLEGVVKLHDKWTIDFLQNVSLSCVRNRNKHR